MAKENVQEVKDPTDDGHAEIKKAIQLTELQQDLVNLQRQSFAISGAIQYIQQKITQLNKGKETELKEVDKV